MRIILATCITVLCMTTGTATALEKGMYFDASAGLSSIKNLSKSNLDSDVNAVGTLNSSTLDDTGVYWGLAIGYRFTPYLAADIGWTNVGTQTYKANFTSSALNNSFKAELQSRGMTTSVTGILPIGKKLELRGRVGAFMANTAINREIQNSVQSVAGYAEEDSIELFGSVAAAYKFTPKFSVYASAHHFNKVGSGNVTGESNINGVSLGVTFRQ